MFETVQVIPMDPTIYELLATQQSSATTTEQLHSATKNTFIDKTNIEFWSGMITVARAISESRTYGHGLPIPETGKIASLAIADGANSGTTFQPSGTELWRVQVVDFQGCTVALVDASGQMAQVLSINDADSPLSAPLILSNTLYIKFFNGSGSEKTPVIAYMKVGL